MKTLQCNKYIEIVEASWQLRFRFEEKIYTTVSDTIRQASAQLGRFRKWKIDGNIARMRGFQGKNAGILSGFRVFLTQKAAIIVDIYKNLEFSESP